jgi:hypothetical protein
LGDDAQGALDLADLDGDDEETDGGRGAQRVTDDRLYERVAKILEQAGGKSPAA